MRRTLLSIVSGSVLESSEISRRKLKSLGEGIWNMWGLGFASALVLQDGVTTSLC